MYASSTILREVWYSLCANNTILWQYGTICPQPVQIQFELASLSQILNNYDLRSLSETQPANAYIYITRWLVGWMTPFFCFNWYLAFVSRFLTMAMTDLLMSKEAILSLRMKMICKHLSSMPVSLFGRWWNTAFQSKNNCNCVVFFLCFLPLESCLPFSIIRET